MLSTALGWLSKQSVHLSHLRVSDQNRIIYAALIAATCLIGWCYKGFIQNHSRDTPSPVPPGAKPSSSPIIPRSFSFSDIFAWIRRQPTSFPTPNGTTPVLPAMRYQRQVRLAKKSIFSSAVSPPPLPKSKQPYDVFLVLDVEATCQQGADFNFPNEIIVSETIPWKPVLDLNIPPQEFPVCLMKWKDRTNDKTASKLEVVAEFRSFVKPTWRPNLSEFCTSLTGITQVRPVFPFFSACRLCLVSNMLILHDRAKLILHHHSRRSLKCSRRL